MALLEGETKDDIVVAYELEFWLAERRVEHHVRFRCLSSTMLAIVELSKGERILW